MCASVKVCDSRVALFIVVSSHNATWWYDVCGLNRISAGTSSQRRFSRNRARISRSLANLVIPTPPMNFDNFMKTLSFFYFNFSSTSLKSHYNTLCIVMINLKTIITVWTYLLGIATVWKISLMFHETLERTLKILEKVEDSIEVPRRPFKRNLYYEI